MRKPPSLLVFFLAAWSVMRIAQAQNAAAAPSAPQPATTARQAVGQQDAGAPAVLHSKERQPAHAAIRARADRPSAPDTSARKTHEKTPGAKDDVLSLGASDITGNKELPKVMVIVPWKSSTGADGVIRPEDSLMNEVLGPVDRGVFQRRIRYYRQLNAAQRPRAAEGSEARSRKP